MAKLKDAALAVRPYSFVSDEEWQAIFRHVERGDTLAAAIRVALGAGRDPSVCYTALRNDPLGLGRRYSNAQEMFRSVVVAEIKRRAIDGTPEPDYYEGRVVGFTKKYSDKLLSDLARNLPGSDWLDARKASDITTHKGPDAAADVVFSLDYATVAEMPPHIRRSLMPALTWLKEHVNAKEPRELATSDPINVTPESEGYAMTDAQKKGDWS